MNQSHEQSDSIMRTPKPLMSQTLYLLNPLTYDHETLHVQSTLHLENFYRKRNWKIENSRYFPRFFYWLVF